jgi:hypothetical protein
MPGIPSTRLDDKSPTEVNENIHDKAPPPCGPAEQGLSVELAPDDRQRPHQLVTIGDSLTMGFQHGAVFRTDRSWPALAARAMGIDGFRYPRFEPPDGPGGLPLDLERLARALADRPGPNPLFARSYLDAIEDYWERGAGRLAPDRDGPINHNLAVYGWDLRDALSLDADTLETRIIAPRDQFLNLSTVVENDNDRAGMRVLNSARGVDGRPLSSVGAAQELGREGIENLVVMLGANNALTTVTDLDVVWSAAGYDQLVLKDPFTVWTPEHFRAELEELVAELRLVGARRVVLATVPHVTIAPIARGVGERERPDSRYFPFYSRPWIGDHQFDPRVDPHITGAEARAVDAAIDLYNEAIAGAIQDARRDGLDWLVFDVSSLLDRFANRRYMGAAAAARPEWWTEYQLPDALDELEPGLDTRFFRADRTGRTHGGVFGLDGVHPTTVTYGVVAEELLRLLDDAGAFADGRHPRIDFEEVLGLDTLVSDPPSNIDLSLDFIGALDEVLDAWGWIFRLGRAPATD